MSILIIIIGFEVRMFVHRLDVIHNSLSLFDEHQFFNFYRLVIFDDILINFLR